MILFAITSINRSNKYQDNCRSIYLSNDLFIATTFFLAQLITFPASCEINHLSIKNLQKCQQEEQINSMNRTMKTRSNYHLTPRTNNSQPIVTTNSTISPILFEMSVR